MSDPFRDTEKDEELRTTIILKMVNLVRSGVTTPDELRVQTLKSLSLRSFSRIVAGGRKPSSLCRNPRRRSRPAIP
jgi:hypothetical protein